MELNALSQLSVVRLRGNRFDVPINFDVSARIPSLTELDVSLSYAINASQKTAYQASLSTGPSLTVFGQGGLWTVRSFLTNSVVIVLLRYSGALYLPSQ